MVPHQILNASNASLTVTSFRGSASVDSLGAAPLGTADDTATGEVALKVKTVGAGTTTDQAIQTLLGGTGSLKDNGPAWTTSFGVAGARFTSADQSATAAAVTSAPTSGQKLVITDVLFSSDTALRLDFSIETAGTVLFSVYLSSGSSGQFTPRGKLKLATADKKLMVQASVAGNIAVTPLYYSEA